MIKVVVIHLTHLYPFLESDQWRGDGFTQWANVTKAKPLFNRNYQPLLSAPTRTLVPSDLCHWNPFLTLILNFSLCFHQAEYASANSWF